MKRKWTMHNMKFDNEYKKWLINLKSRVRQSQIKAANVVNTALIEFYWDLGKMISEKETVWGSKLIEQVAKDLKQEFPDMQGLSRRNLFNAKKFYLFYNSKQLVQQPVALTHQQVADKLQVSKNKQRKNNSKLVQQVVALNGKQTADKLQVFDNKQRKNRSKLVQQLVVQIPWGHNILIFTKVKELKNAQIHWFFRIFARPSIVSISFSLSSINI